MEREKRLVGRKEKLGKRDKVVIYYRKERGKLKCRQKERSASKKIDEVYIFVCTLFIALFIEVEKKIPNSFKEYIKSTVKIKAKIGNK